MSGARTCYTLHQSQDKATQGQRPMGNGAKGAEMAGNAAILRAGERGDRCLVMVDGDNNHNKRYDMVVNGDGTFTAFWGRITDEGGHPAQHKTYPMAKYDSMLASKLKKGYRDVSAYNSAFSGGAADMADETARRCNACKDPKVAGMMLRLMRFADSAVAASYKVGAESVTAEAIAEARRQIAKMGEARSIKAFNESYEELLTVIPRRIGRVSDVLAKGRSDFGDIITRESDLLDVLEGQAKVADQHRRAAAATAAGADDRDILQMLGLEMFVATDEQHAHVMRHLGDSLRGRVRGVYRVRNLATEERFDKWCEEHGKPEIKEFWHGSRNENWVSIMQNGLLLNPNAVTTGKMFGAGTYFAPSPSKSFNYTSYRGTTWAGGTSDTGIMGLYAVAYGKPYVVSDNHQFTTRFGWGDLQRIAPGSDCVHAKAGRALRADEVIFYREEQTTINYLVDFGH